MPPPPPVEELPDIVLLITIRVLPKLKMPPPPPDELPEIVLLVTISVLVLSSRMPPPPSVTQRQPVLTGEPFSMVTPEITTVSPGAGIWKTRTDLFPLIARLDGPGPLIVRLVVMSSVLLSVIVPVTPKLIVSPELAAAIAARREPSPLSFVFVTVIVLAKPGDALKSTSTISATQPTTVCSSLLPDRCICGSLLSDVAYGRLADAIPFRQLPQ